MDILETMHSWAERDPEKIAHHSGTASLSYGDLSRGVRSIAAHLNATLGDNRAPVVVRGHKEPELLVAFLGAIQSGRAYVPVDIMVPEERLNQIIETVDAKVVLTPEAVTDIVKRVAPAEQKTTPLRDSDAYYVMFTSGSTGLPKGVVVTYGNIKDFIEWMFGEHPFKPQREIFLNQTPFSFDVSVMDIYGSLLSGGSFVSVTRNEVANLSALFPLLQRSNATIWVSTPSFAQLCIKEPTFQESMMPGVTRFLFCGEPLPNELSKELLQRFPKAEVWNTYGPTEATVATTSLRIDQKIVEKYPTLPIGYSKPRSQILIMDDERKLVKDGERGEIIIVGPNVSPGYLKRPELTEKVFFEYKGEAAYCTGDWGFLKDGMFFCEGRRDNQIKLHGYRIELGDIEANLRRVEGISEAVVVPKRKDGVPEYLGAFVVLTDGNTEPAFEVVRNIKKQLALALPTYMVPQRFIFLTDYPMTANGKADRKKLAEELK